jgi:Tetracyclin repressor-like, C-terminal domain
VRGTGHERMPASSISIIRSKERSTARALRASIHGFVALEAAGGFGLPRAVDRSFERMIEMLDAGMRSWPVPRTRRRSEPPRR